MPSVLPMVLAAAVLAAAAPADRTAEVPGLLITLKSDEPQARAGAARGLGEIGASARDAVPDLVAALKDPERDVRQSAAQALGDIGPAARPAVTGLAIALGDAEWQVRRAAADSLGRIGTREGEPFLKAARKDKHPSVRKAASASLDKVKKLPKPGRS